ncbi:MAG: hypothetical protein HRU35_02840 [Rickettsiaceae bacterium]|nr:hypothetical protein [Rickettsiaceae bacterium]
MKKLDKKDFAKTIKLKPGDKNYKIFKNQAKEDTLFTSFAYKQVDEDMATAMQDIADNLPNNNYQLLLMTDHLFDTKKYSYRCAVFIDYENKKIVFANAGTRPKFDERGFHDLIDDGMLILRKQPFKVTQAAALNEMILDSLGDQAGEFEFHYTGHSLGAAVAEIAAVDMDIKLTERSKKQGKQFNKNQVSAVTFENPGTKPIVEKMYKKAGLKNNTENLKFTTINNRNNIINTLNNQVVKPCEIVPSSQGARGTNPLQLFAAYLSKKICQISYTVVGRVISKAIGLLAPGTLSLATEHSLSNYERTFVEKKGVTRDQEGNVVTIEEAATDYKSVKYEKTIFLELQAMKKENNIGSPEYIMSYVDKNSLTTKFITCSQLELKTAVDRFNVRKKINQDILSKKNEKESFTEQVLSEKSSIDSKQETKIKKSKYQLRTASEIVGKSQSSRNI